MHAERAQEMERAVSSTLGHFRSPEKSLGEVDPQIVARLIAAAADIALVIDENGIVQDSAFGESELAATAGDFIGRPWVDTVSPDSRAKVEQLLTEANTRAMTRSREVNQQVSHDRDIPVRFSAIRLGGSGRILAIGRDLRSIASLQQQLVSAQQSMERDYARLRHAETRYRLLFQIASEAVLIVNTTSYKVAEANPAAGKLLEQSPPQIIGQSLSNFFAEASWSELQSLLGSVRVSGWAEDVTSRLPTGRDVIISASLFRQDNASLFLVRLADAREGIEPAPGRTSSRLLDVVQALPDAFVVIGADRRVLTANNAFLDLTQLAAEQQVLGEPLDRWVGRPGVDVNILMANLREHGSVRNFATVVHGEFGSVEQAEISGVSAMHGDQQCFGFVIRAIPRRMTRETPTGPELPQSVEQLTGLVGRVPLKEIVRETTDVIERLCIEAALDVSGDNRASAAQMLGLSRQSLYAKLRRYGLGDLESGGGTQ